MTQDRIILAAGGTGGHVFPAVALGEELKKRGYEVLFLTDQRGEKYLKNQPYQVIRSGNGLKQIHKIYMGILDSTLLYFKAKPLAVVGFGGYPSFAPLVGAKILRKRIVIHEQNSVVGKVNRIFKKEILASSFASTGGTLVGNPVRPEIKPVIYPDNAEKLNILVTGGSQGAKLFAEILPQAFVAMKDKFKITHQVREQELAEVEQFYRENGVEAEIKPFFNDMPERLAKAHLVICRSGSSTIAELNMVGRPAIFVPLAIAADNHQELNARSVCDVGAGWMILEKDFTVEVVTELLAELTYSKLAIAAKASSTLAKPDSASRLADIVLGIDK